MINLMELNAAELAKIGIAFRTEEEVRLFAEVIIDELEVRIGERIGAGLSDKKLEEFDQCATPEEAREWLERHCPDYEDIVIRTQSELANEMIEYRDRIAGVIDVAERD